MSAIACDMDGVVANFTVGFSKLCHKLNPDAPIVDYPDVQSWNWHEWYGFGDTVEEAWKIIRAPYDTEKGLNLTEMFWLGLDPMFNLDYLKRVYMECPVVFLTRRDGALALEQTEMWLYRQGLTQAQVRVVKGGEEKSEVCAKLGISTLIDDSPAYAQEALDAGMNVVLVTYQYNRHVPEQPRLWRAFSLEMALKIAKEMDEEVR